MGGEDQTTGPVEAVIHFAGFKAVGESIVDPLAYWDGNGAGSVQLLADLAGIEPGWRIARLRYFNPVGAHPSGRIGEDPHGTASNLFPFVSQVAVGRRERLQVDGGDWPTPDGSGVLDYIHVMD